MFPQPASSQGSPWNPLARASGFSQLLSSRPCTPNTRLPFWALRGAPFDSLTGHELVGEPSWLLAGNRLGTVFLAKGGFLLTLGFSGL